MTADSPTTTSQLNRFQFPIIGDLSTIDFNKPVQKVTDKLTKLGSGMIEQPIGQPVIFLADTTLIDDVNDETHWEKHLGSALRRVRSVLGDGLFTAYNHEPNWRKAHNILMPTFTKTAMKLYHDTMAETIRELVDVWNRKSAVRAWITIPADANRLTIEIIARVAMGYSFTKLSDSRENAFIAAFLRELAYADRHTADIAQERKDQHNKDATQIRRQVADIIRARRLNSTAGSRDDMLDIILHSTDPDTGDQLDNDNIISQILTLLVAGSETSANAIAFALHFLSINPNIAEQARAEIDEHWSNDTFPNIHFDDVDKLRYLRRVVDETLRLWPVVPGYFRQARQDTTIGTGKHFFRGGDWVFVHLIAAHRSDAWGHDAHEFNPDRFLPENLRKLPRRIYKPFGTGARACLGRRFALHETLLTLAAVLHQYDLEPRPGYCLSASEAMTLKPVDLQLRLHRR
ncbi:cytochrome P450 [Mycobacterium decipiens]|uniref:Cytochrome P450 n=1 Tax=Mycobacterium decipiens TaxID=1430326 RepID=A0A1X2LPZ7_9MYCO|nr:cytochrome P450 [Mycobacterium decipiens]OSC38170.1 cytochrome P450 [Mycobacterium decipiens]